MYVKKELKLNKFREVAIPNKGEYMKRFGAINTPANYSGDEIAMQRQERKTEAMHDYEAWVKENSTPADAGNENQEQ